jgi:hypothetical protein
MTETTYDNFPYADGAAPAVLRLDRNVHLFLAHTTTSRPEDRITYSEMRLAYQEEAKRFVKVMLLHMPQGLTDAIFAELASQKASLFIVPQLKE